MRLVLVITLQLEIYLRRHASEWRFHSGIRGLVVSIEELVVVSRHHRTHPLSLSRRRRGWEYEQKFANSEAE